MKVTAKIIFRDNFFEVGTNIWWLVYVDEGDYRFVVSSQSFHKDMDSIESSLMSCFDTFDININDVNVVVDKV